tara:strand:+ start:438 stop:1202 length:765 start_codon:yes stop_codon:yes gene_type:complete
MNTILIIVPTKNSTNYLGKLVKSLLDQEDPNWRVIFIDFKSEKSHKYYLENICKHDKRFTVKKQISKTGIYGAQNLGFKYCNNNEWILFWGADDYASNGKVISNIRRTILKNKLHDLIIFKGRFVDLKTGKEKSKDHFSKLKTRNLQKYTYKQILFFGFRQSHQGTLINPRLNLKNLRYDEKLYLAADLNFYLDCSNKKGLISKTVNTQIVDIGIGGISRKKHIRRFTEVIYIYWKSFKFLFFVPFILRYIKWL